MVREQELFRSDRLVYSGMSLTHVCPDGNYYINLHEQSSRCEQIGNDALPIVYSRRRQLLNMHQSDF